MIARLSLAAFAVLLLVGRPEFPGGIQPPDLVFLILALAVAREGLPVRRADRWLGLWVLGALAATLAHPSQASAWELAKIVYGPAILLVVRAASLRGSRTLAVRCFVLAASVVAIFTALSALSAYLGSPNWTPLLWRHPTRSGMVLWRARGFFEVPEMLGEVLTVAAPLALAWRSESGGIRKAWLSAGLGALLVAGGLSLSHALVGLAGALLVFSWSGLSRWARRCGTLAWGALFIVMVTLSSALPRPANAPSLSPFGQHVVMTSQVVVWNRPWIVEWFHYGALKGIALDAFLDSPLFGVGPGGFNERSREAARRGVLTPLHSGADPHCELTGKLAETGFAGTIPMLFLWAWWIREGRLARDIYARAAAAAVLGILANGVHVDFMNFRFLWFALAILESAPNRRDHAPGAVSRSPHHGGNPAS